MEILFSISGFETGFRNKPCDGRPVPYFRKVEVCHPSEILRSGYGGRTLFLKPQPLQEDSNRVCSSLEEELSSRRQRHEEDAAHSAAALESARAAADTAQTALAAARARAQEEGAGRSAAERQVTELQQLVRQMEGGRERTEAAVWELQVSGSQRKSWDSYEFLGHRRVYL